ncbi:MAG: hypothetical protein LBI44_00975 [Oscillospiraceae bacterium]|jgi:hypothetical protein|nr:hypothetical protein [Oscillospiraceae bacterium]
MPVNEVLDMILEALRAMAIGIPGVFMVLFVFYVTLKTLMRSKNKE